MARNPLRRYFRHGLLPQLIAFEACLRLGGVTQLNAENAEKAKAAISALGNVRNVYADLSNGIVNFRNRRHQPAPSTAAASYSSGEIDCNPARYITIVNPENSHTNTNITHQIAVSGSASHNRCNDSNPKNPNAWLSNPS